MNPDVISLYAEDPAMAAVDEMAKRDIHRIVVLDGESRLAGIVTPAFLNHNRVKFWLGIFIGSNFVTPGADPFTPLLLTVPLIVLFEISIQVIRALRK